MRQLPQRIQGEGVVKQIKTSVSPELEAWLEEKADEEKRSVSSMVRVLLYEAKLREEETAVA